jgi:predicted N-acetyltransferase YhbS
VNWGQVPKQFSWKLITMAASFLVENTKESDQPLIEQLLDIAFGIDRRVKTSYRLREGSAPADGLSLVVRDADVGLAGSISFWPLAIGLTGTPALLLGPLVVHPKRQNLGVGLTLMQEGLARVKASGHTFVILVGDAPYYARVGFLKLPEGQLMMPGRVDPQRFLYVELVPGALGGMRGLVLPPHRFAEISVPLAVPHQAERQKQSAECQ